MLSREELVAVAEELPSVIWTSTLRGKIDYLNPWGAAFFGIVRETSPPSWTRLLHPDDVSRTRDLWQQAAVSEHPVSLAVRLRRADGEFRWHQVRGRVARTGTGPPRWLGSATDIHDELRHSVEMEAAGASTREALLLLEGLEVAAHVGFAFVDQDLRVVRVNQALATVGGGSPSSQIGRPAGEVIPHLWSQVEWAFRRVLATGEPTVNVEVSGRLNRGNGPMAYGLANFCSVDAADGRRGVGLVVVDITERKRFEETTRTLTLSVVEAIAATIEARDPYTAGHQKSVASLSRAIAQEAGSSSIEVEGIGVGAALHDIGKISVPVEILTKPTALRPAEAELMKAHSREGYDILRGIQFPWPVAEMILHHHERYDGTGYPDRISGEDIEVGARIIAVADSFDAISSHRPYRPGLGIEQTLAELDRGSGTFYDPQFVDVCSQLVRRGWGKDQ